MKGKVTRKIENWSAYNKALISRGNINLWLTPEVLANWNNPPKTGKRGRPFLYSDDCVQLAFIVRAYFSLRLRQTEGFLKSLLERLDIGLSVLSYSQMSRRAATLNISLPTTHKPGEAIDIVIDSTGLKIYGEGEWKVKIHGKDKRRTWRKLHIAMNPANFEIVEVELTDSNVHDGQVLPRLLEGQENRGKKVYGDGAYGSKSNFEAIVKTGATAMIALSTGIARAKETSPGLIERNRLLDEIWDAGGKHAWKKTSGYHRRSLVETVMFRVKQILGPKLASRKWVNQVAEVRLKMHILNRLTQLGMPAYSSA